MAFRRDRTRRPFIRMGAAAFGAVWIALILAAGLSALTPARQQRQASRAGDYIGGTVASPKGAEAGVWVIAETTETPTRLTKIVVTDDQGRFMLPEMPNVTFNVWVRGYGIVDSAPDFLWHIEGGKGQKSKMIHFQMRPDPLAR